MKNYWLHRRLQRLRLNNFIEQTRKANEATAALLRSLGYIP